MEMFAQVIGFDPAGLGFKVAFAVQGVFVLMFIVAPIFGYLFLEKTKQLSSLWLALFSGLFVAVVTHTGLMWLLRKAIPPAQLSDTALALLAGGAAASMGLLTLRAMHKLLSDQQRSFEMDATRQLSDAELLPFERKRKAHMERRRR